MPCTMQGRSPRSIRLDRIKPSAAVDRRAATPSIFQADDSFSVYAVSDVHVDHTVNLDWVQKLSESSHFRNDILILPGDATHDLSVLATCLRCFKAAFRCVRAWPCSWNLCCSLGKWPVARAVSNSSTVSALSLSLRHSCALLRQPGFGLASSQYPACLQHTQTHAPAIKRVLKTAPACLGKQPGHVCREVFFCPGNHELWVHLDGLAPHDASVQREPAEDSAQKLHQVLDLCLQLGVLTAPTKVADCLWIVPILSWHHQSWDTEPQIPGAPPASRLTIPDYVRCVWPEAAPGAAHGSRETAEWIDREYNDSEVLKAVALDARETGAHVISFSHFLPFQELLPEKRFLYFPNLVRGTSCAPLCLRAGGSTF